MDEAEDLDWLTDMDLEILEFMSCEFILSPTIIAENIGRSREGVSSRLSALQAGGLVAKLDRGKYRITRDGLDVWYHFDKEEYRRRRLEVLDYKTFKAKTGITKQEYERRVQEEHERIKREEPDCDDPLGKAFQIVDERIQDN
jgi:predicted transcriptional regulator